MDATVDPALAVVRLLGEAAVRYRPLGGTAFRVELAGGRSVVAKSGGGRVGASLAEAAGLRWLAAAGGAPLPDVLAADDSWVITEYVPTGRADASAAAALGAGLAAMHAAGAPAFGAGPPGGAADAWIGRAPMRNDPTPTSGGWPGWYAEHRVLPYLRAARDAGSLSATEAEPIEAVCGALPELAGPPEPPARLHGDLWAGNVLFSGGAGWLIDPAAHGGHRETDLAMLALFGCPRLDEILASYHDARPLAPGWPHRVPLHQLFPLLVHVVLFGRGYASQAVAAARSALELRRRLP